MTVYFFKTNIQNIYYVYYKAIDLRTLPTIYFYKYFAK